MMEEDMSITAIAFVLIILLLGFDFDRTGQNPPAAQPGTRRTTARHMML